MNPVVQLPLKFPLTNPPVLAHVQPLRAPRDLHSPAGSASRNEK